MGGLRILQINLNHCKDANDALGRYVSDNDFDIVLVQDPYVFNNSTPGIPPNWHSFFSHNNNAAIFLTNIDFLQ